MGRREKDTHSMASRASAERARKPARFSLQRLFHRGRPPSLTSSRSAGRHSVPTTSEIESRSSASIPSTCAPPAASHTISLEESHSSVTSSSSSSHASKQDVASGPSKSGTDTIECPLCLSFQPRDNFPSIMTCHHRSCRHCLQQYLRIEITESRVNIACPECAEKFHPNDIEIILENNHLMRKYEEFMLRRVLATDPDTRWCPAPDCGYAVIATGCASCPKLKCERPTCDTFFCYHCKQYWHPNQTCDAARAERSSNLRSSSATYSSDSSHNDIKPCPRCGAFIVKMDDGSCNHMTCAVCGAEFCWLCMKEISDLHYLSPSGCTFWGKKPWSRKKKILWQLGTLVGAPVGISLIAGMAVPAIIIGVPLYVGRKLHTKYQYTSRHKRNLIVTGGVTASIVLSPLLAGIAVGIGVPILLAYVYGVVPFSLCRSGVCGVTATNKGGVRFEFDEEVEGGAGPQSPHTPGDTQSVETSTAHHVTNPSIGPSIGEMSLAMTASLSASGSHLERGGVLLREDSVDRDSASNRALAGTSLTGSLCGSAYAHSRLEVQAEVSNAASSHKRNSVSSESANLSLDTKSGTVSFGDNASTKALAGSISTHRESVCREPVCREPGCREIGGSGGVDVDVASTSARYQTPALQCPSTLQSLPSVVDMPPPVTSQQDSPTASRSVNFLNEVTACPPHYSERQTVSLGDSLHMDQQQLHRADVCSLPQIAPIYEGRVGVSVDSVLPLGAAGLAEVEADYPQRASTESTVSQPAPHCARLASSGCCLHGEACAVSTSGSSCGSVAEPDAPLIVTGLPKSTSSS